MREGARRRLRLLDLAFSLLVWAGYVLAVFVTQSMACNVWADMGEGEREVVTGLLVGVGVLTIAIIGLHGWRRHSSSRTIHDSDVLVRLTIALDVIATVAVAWMLIAILFTPLCA